MLEQASKLGIETDSVQMRKETSIKELKQLAISNSMFKPCFDLMMSIINSSPESMENVVLESFKNAEKIFKNL